MTEPLAAPTFGGSLNFFMQTLSRATILAAVGTGLLAGLGLSRTAGLLLRSDAPGRAFARLLARSCQALGPSFVKSAQIASTRPDLLALSLHEPLARLRHHAAPQRLSRLRLPDTLRDAIRDGTLTVEETPIAAGSIANVYLAREAETGRLVALKVRRPALKQKIETDFRIMLALAGLVERLPGVRPMPLRGALGELREIVLRQVDFEAEAANLTAFARTYRSWTDLVFPEVIPRHCGPDVLAMSYIPDLDPAWIDHPPGPHTARQVARAMAFLFDMVFIAGRVHADLHPGNLIFRADGKIAVVDIGMVAEMTAFRKRMFVYFFFGMVTNSAGMCAHVLLETASGRGEAFDEGRFRADLAALIARYSSLSAREYEVAGFVGELFALQQRHQLHASPDFTTTILAFLMLEGMVKILYPDADFQRAARDYILQNAVRAGVLTN